MGAGTGSDISITFGSVTTFKYQSGNGDYTASTSADYSGAFGSVSAAVTLTANPDIYVSNSVISVARLTYNGLYLTNTGSSREKVVFDTSFYGGSNSFASGSESGEAGDYGDVYIPGYAFAALGTDSWTLYDAGGDSSDNHSTVQYNGGFFVSDPYTWNHTAIFSLPAGASIHFYAAESAEADAHTRLASTPSPAAVLPYGLSVVALVRRRRRRR